MKLYPSIPAEYSAEAEYFCFDKLDGSNIRVEWTARKGFQRFGTRRYIIDDESLFFPATVLIKEKFETALGEVFRKQGYQAATCFFEYFGPNSFAGRHPDIIEYSGLDSYAAKQPNIPIKMQAILIDVNVYRVGMLPPERFLEEFGNLEIPRFLGKHKLTPDLIESIKSGSLEGMTFEGIIGKKFSKNKLQMVKVKNRAWLTKLRNTCHSDEEFQHRA